MTNHPSSWSRWGQSTILALAAGLSLTACWGGDDGDVQAADTSQAPAWVTDSTAAYLDFAQSLAVTDTGEPLGLDQVAMPPISELDDPTPLT